MPKFRPDGHHLFGARPLPRRGDDRRRVNGAPSSHDPAEGAALPPGDPLREPREAPRRGVRCRGLSTEKLQVG